AIISLNRLHPIWFAFRPFGPFWPRPSSPGPRSSDPNLLPSVRLYRGYPAGCSGSSFLGSIFWAVLPATPVAPQCHLAAQEVNGGRRRKFRLRPVMGLEQ